MTVAYDQCMTMLREWTNEYPVGIIRFVGFEDLGSKTLGVTRYNSTPEIALNDVLSSHPIWMRVVLWHEFAHCAAYYEASKVGQGHGEKFRAWQWKKPLLALLDLICPQPSLL